MPTLDCSVKNCYYNKEDKCCREDILVEGKNAKTTDATACDSFKMKNDEFTNSCHCDASPNNDLKVACRAENCKYNEEYMCNARHIDIAGASASKSEQTECGAFSMR